MTWVQIDQMLRKKKDGVGRAFKQNTTTESSYQTMQAWDRRVGDYQNQNLYLGYTLK